MSQTKRITLYGAVGSPFPHRVRLALEEAKAEYDIIWIDLVNKPEWYAQKVPNNGKVPFLVYGGPKLLPGSSPSPGSVQLSESLIILEFLADLFPDAHLLPEYPTHRAHARLFAHTVDAVFVPAFGGFLSGGPAEPLYAALDKLQTFLSPDMDEGFVAGAGWSIADAAFAPFMVLMETMLAQRPPSLAPGTAEVAEGVLRSARFARLQRWKRDVAARPSMAVTYDEPAVIQKFWERMEKEGKKRT